MNERVRVTSWDRNETKNGRVGRDVLFRCRSHRAPMAAVLMDSISVRRSFVSFLPLATRRSTVGTDE